MRQDPGALDQRTKPTGVTPIETSSRQGVSLRTCADGVFGLYDFHTGLSRNCIAVSYNYM